LENDIKKKYYNNKLLCDSKLQKNFSQIIKGYVSFLNTGAFVNYKYVGDLKIGPSQLTIVKVHPKPLQYAGYAKAYNIDVKKQKKHTCFKLDTTRELVWGKDLSTLKTSEKSGIYSNAIQASLFVWDKAIELYRGKGKSRKLVKEKDFWLKNLSEYSAIYGKIIKKIKNDKKKHFIYLKKVEGSGSKLLFQILQRCGINSKYIQSQKDTEEFNTPGNSFRVAIGTAKISLGLTLRNIDYIHIAEPDWNFPPIDQAIARAIRHGSHDRKNTIIEIFLYALIIKGKRDCSVNYLQYEKCSEKLHATKIMTEILQKNAIDCQLFKKQNKTAKCTGITSKHSINYLTYNLYYAPYEQIRNDIIDLFNRQFILSLEQINKRLPQYNQFELMNALSRINSENVIIYNRWGFKNYLRYNNNIYFLVIDKFSKGDWLDVYYSQFIKNNPLSIPDNQLINILFANQCQFIIRTFETNENMHIFFKEFPINIQEKILQFILTQKKTKFPIFGTWLRTKYNKVWKKKKGIILVYLQYLKDRTFPIKEWNGKEWKDSKTKIDFGKEIYDTFVKKNKFIGVQDDKLIILDVRNVKELKKSQGSKKLRGIACTSMKDERWPALLKFLKIADSGTQKQLCKQVVEKLYEKNLIIDKNERHMLNIYMKDNKLAFFKN